MESFLRKVINKKFDDEAHKYFVRFGKGLYNRRFIMSVNKSKDKIKIRASFEMANDFVQLANSLDSSLKFSGKILMKDKVQGKEGKKKAGVFVYEISSEGIDDYQRAYFYLLDANNSDILLKIKKSLPKPGKDAEKIDDKFCSLDINVKYWAQVKETFFWDVPECKKATVENDLHITEIEMPKNEKDPVKIRENSLRKGKIIRRINFDGKDISKEYELAA